MRRQAACSLTFQSFFVKKGQVAESSGSIDIILTAYKRIKKRKTLPLRGAENAT
jgi:hypothetical protein